MKEKEYILVKNLANVTAALNILRDVLPDFDGVVTKSVLQAIQSTLAEWQEEAHKKIDVVA